MLGEHGAVTARITIREAIVKAVSSSECLRLIDRAVDDVIEQYLSRPIGRLDHLVPPGVVEGVCRSMREMATRALITEVPTIVSLIQISRMVSDRIDSFDLLRLEELLLSIMEEQFRYINLFGALLGFFIGCANLLFIVSA